MSRRLSMTFLATSIVLMDVAFSFALEYSRGVSIFRDYFAIWENEISHEMIVSKNDQLLKKIIAQAPLLHSSLQISSIQANGKKQEIQTQSECYFPVKQSLTYNLIPVGEVSGCLQTANLFELAMTSPLFIGVIAFGILGLFFYSKKEEKIRLELQLSQFLTTISRQVAHDIRAPLMAIQTVLSSTEGLEPARKKLLQEASSRIQAIAADLLDQTRFQNLSREQNLLFEKSENVNANRSQGCQAVISVRSLAEQFQATHPQLELKVDANCSENIEVPLSKQVLDRMMTNLIQNSVEAISENGKITIQISAKAEAVYITILDNGAGMSEEQLQNMGRVGMTTKEKGNGLGVSYVRQQIQDAGGKFEVSSKLGVGTQVQLMIPISPR